MQESFNLMVKIIRFEIWLFLSAFGLYLLFRIVTGEINLFGLITDKRTNEISPSRIQSLILTFAAIGVLLSELPALTGTGIDLAAMVFGGSQAVYLFTKSESFQK